SSPTFTLAFALFENVREAEACAQTIAGLKTTLGVREFHWIDLNDARRTSFLNAILQHEFYYLLQTVEKTKLKHRDFRKKAFFYERVAEKMAEAVADFLHLAQGCCLPKPLNMSVVLERNDDADYMRSMGKHLRKIKDAHGRSLVGKVSSRRSIGDNLVQLADMICGALLHPTFDTLIHKKKWKELRWP